MLKQMKRDEIGGWGLLGPLLRGIQSHMGSSVERTRKFGIVPSKQTHNHIILKHTLLFIN